jgi:acyl-CoA synthetase (AMP-forming)/AMP-acid ligase II
MNLASPLFEVARRLPQRPAVSTGAGTLTFAALVDHVARIAGSFAATLAPGDRVAVCMENSPEVIELYFACWTAGLCLVPTNAKLHPKEVAYIAESSGAKLLFTTPSLAGGLAPLERELPSLQGVICTGTDRYQRLLDGPAARPRPLEPTDPAWIFFTSGTTGRPKGAVLSHRNLMFMSHAYYADIDSLDERDTQLHIAPLSHGGGLYSLPHLFKGSHQVILGGSFDPARTYDAIARHPKVTLFAAPTVLTRLVHSDAARRADLTNLKTIYYGGGPMYVADLKKALSLFGPRLYQLFGQGESPMTITGLSQRLHAATDHPRYEEMLGSCGYARTGVEVKVVDADDRQVPFGEIGEVITRSDCVMQGYYGNPKATAETLRNGWLHTGDLGSMDADGLLTLRDRSKDMIISGGSNIYPRELEELLLHHANVLEVSVVGRPHPEWGEEVVAFVVAKAGKQVSTSELDQLCLDNLARYKRPRDYRFVDSLPKNNYGKVLKTELRQRLQSGAK